MQADRRFQHSIQAERSGDLPKAVTEAAHAYALDPYLTLRVFRLALLEARLAGQTGDPHLIQSAIEHYEQGLHYEPIWGLNSANLAGLLWQHGKQADAIKLMERTVQGEEAPLYWVNLGYFYEQQGNWSKAIAAYGRALFLSPDLAASGFWQVSPNRAQHWPLVIEAATKHLSATPEVLRRSLRIQVALVREEFDTIETLTSGEVQTLAAADDQIRYALVEFFLEREQSAQASDLLDPIPQNATDYFLWGRVKLQQGDDKTAENFLKIATFLGHREAYYYLGQLFERQKDFRAAETAYQAGFLPSAAPENIEVTIYDRLGGNDLAPQLIKIGVGPRQAKPWLALADFYERQHRFEEATAIYQLLLSEDPFLIVAQECLDSLETDVPCIDRELR